MAISEVRTTFTIDLNPFAAGLKTMLAMTQQAGKQITPLLNMQVKTPNYGVFDEQLKGLTKTVDDYIAAQVESAKATTTQSGATDDAGQKVDDFEKKNRKASDSVDKHSMSLRHMKRESMEVFGSVSFLVQSLLQLANSATGGDQKIQKMSSSMAQGVSAGFGLASTMALLGLATGGTAAVVGGFITLGVTLLTFFSDSETRAKIAAAAIDMFSRSLRGASTKDLKDYREALQSNILTIDKTIAALEKRRAGSGLGFESIFGTVQGIDAILGTTITAYGRVNQLVGESKAKRKQLIDELKKLDDEEIANQMTSSEVKKRIIELNIQAEQNSYQQRRLLADEDYKKEVERILASNATNEQKKAAVEAAGRAHVVAIKKVDDEERQEKDQHTLRLAEIEDRRRLAVIDVAEKLELATAKTEIERLAIQERYATQRLQVEEQAAKRSIQLEIKRQEAIGGDEAAKKIARLNQVLAALDKEAGDKRAAVRSATNEKLAQLDQQNQAAMRDMQKQAILTQLDAEEKQALANETNEERRTEITRKFATLRLQIEKDAAQYLVKLELDSLTAIEGPLTESQQKRLQQLQDYLQKSEALFGAKKLGINVDANVKVLPVGSVAAQLQKIQDLQNDFNRTTDAGARQRITNELRLEQEKLNRMTMTGEELLNREREVQEERRRLWRETHQVQSALIDSLTNGVRSMFGEFFMVHRQAADQWDAIWISMQNTFISALGEMIVQAIAAEIIGGAIAASSAAITNAAMAAIIPAATTAATMVSIATFGAAGVAGSGAVIGGLAAVRAATIIPGFEKGGKTKKGEAGFIEGFYPEIIAPEKDFYHIARTEMIPQMLMQHEKLAEIKFAKNMSAKFQAASGTSSNAEILNALKRIEEKIEGLSLETEIDGTKFKAMLRNTQYKDKRTGLS